MFGPLLPTLAEERQVIAVDLHGHGRTALGNRAITCAMGDDMAVDPEKARLREVDVLGYSFGGGAAFRLAVQHPEKVRRLVMVSAGFAQDGFYPEMLTMQAQVGAAMADHEGHADVQVLCGGRAEPGGFPSLLDPMGA